MAPGITEALLQCELFGKLTKEEIQPMSSFCQIKNYEAGETIFIPGDQGSKIYIVIDRKPRFFGQSAWRDEMRIYLKRIFKERSMKLTVKPESQLDRSLQKSFGSPKKRGLPPFLWRVVETGG